MFDKAPCYQCENRKVGCHSECQSYQEFSEMRKSHLKKYREECKKKGEFDDYIAGRNAKQYWHNKKK